MNLGEEYEKLKASKKEEERAYILKRLEELDKT